MPTPILLTYRDAIEHLLVHEDATGLETEQDRVRAAVQAAYRELAMEHSWRYLKAHDRINVSNQYTTGTVAYTAATRIVTGSGTVFPSWARYGRLLFSGDDVLYLVAERGGDTSLTLESRLARSTNVAAGTSYTLYRSVYPLPGDFWRLDEVHDEALWKTSYVEPSEWVRLERQIPQVGRPFQWTLLGLPDAFGSMGLGFYGRIKTAQTFDYVYSRQPRRLKYDGYGFYSSQGAGTLQTATKGQSTATFGGVTLEEDVVNCVLRTAMPSATKPPGGVAAAERYAEQKIVTTWDNSVSVTLSSAWQFQKASNHFTLSDPIDLPEYLLDAFERGCERQLAVLTKSDNRGIAEQLYEKAIRKARGRNVMMPPPDSPFDEGWRDPSWALLTAPLT